MVKEGKTNIEQQLLQKPVSAPAQVGNTAGAPADLRVPVIGIEQIREAQGVLQEYRTGKKNLEQRIVANEQWYKLRHWDYIRSGETSKVEPVSGWLFNAIANKHADAMDNFPEANILPREKADREEAAKLTSIVPVVLDQCEYEQCYSDHWDGKLRSGTGVTGVFWDPKKHNGLGDIDIQDMDVLNLFWEPGITDIQKSKNLFSVELWDKDLLEQSYPELKGKLGADAATVTKYIYDDTVDTTKKSLVVDWYYKKYSGGKQVLHYCKFVGDTLLFATENEEQYAARGWYDHGLYPFVFDPQFRVKGSPCGFGYIDIAKGAQEYIDRGDQALQKNMLFNAKGRYFARQDGGVNEEEFCDPEKDVVHVDGNLGEDSLRVIETPRLDGNYITLHESKVNELKEVCGNRDVSTGGTASGVTSAAGIAAMQEAGSKLSRDANKASYRAFKKVILLVVELIRQFYTQPRCFRIQGAAGAEEFVTYDNSGIQMQIQQAKGLGLEDSYRLPLFDIEITAQKQSPYSKLSQNDLAIQFYNAGFFNPQLADQAIACLEMMDFDRKDFVMEKIQRNQMLYQQLQQALQTIAQLNQIVDRLTGSNLSAGFTQGLGGVAQAPASGRADKSGLGAQAKESYTTRNARQQVAESTAPR